MDFDKLYVKELKYNEIMELPSDSKLLKTVLDIGASYPLLINKCVVKNDDIPHELLNFSYKLFVGKDVLDISLPKVFIIDEYGFGNMIRHQSEAIYYCITGFLYQAREEWRMVCLCRFVKHVLSVQKKYIVTFYDDIGVP